MHERLSYSLTSFIQYVGFPLCVVAALASGTFQLVHAASAASVLTMVIVLALIYWTGLWIYRCKRVIATDSGLLVGKAGQEVEVAWREVASIFDFRFSSPHLIVVRLKEAGPAGERIVFFATYWFAFGFNQHPVVRFMELHAGLRET